MRPARLLVGTIVSLVLVVPASGVAAAEVAVKPHRDFTYSKIVKLPNGSLSFRAQVARYPNGFIALMKKTCASCTWNRVALRRTNAYGRIMLPVTAPADGRWYWRYRTPETPAFATTYSATWYTFRR